MTTIICMYNVNLIQLLNTKLELIEIKLTQQIFIPTFLSEVKDMLFQGYLLTQLNFLNINHNVLELYMTDPFEVKNDWVYIVKVPLNKNTKVDYLRGGRQEKPYRCRGVTSWEPSHFGKFEYENNDAEHWKMTNIYVKRKTYRLAYE